VNYKHLHYFMQVAKLGGVQRASERLHVTPQTISGQVQSLEDSLGSTLFQRSGRGMALTEIGRLVLGYAEEIFSTGAELEAAVRERAKRGPRLEFRIGVSDAVPKSIACRLIEPATRLSEQVRIVCHEWKIDSLLAGLALHRLDLVISDAPIASSVSVRAFSHRLGASGTTFFAAPQLRKGLAGAFPGCLEGAPMLMPGEDSALGRRLRSWFETRALHPNVVGEFDDRALAEEFARRGAGVLVGPSVLSSEMEKQYGVTPVGVADGLEDEFYAISIERRIRHPCVVAITESARSELLAVRPKRPRARVR
jgi:LysR family transcriptional regulator, transcriptional activator of nhaA